MSEQQPQQQQQQIQYPQVDGNKISLQYLLQQHQQQSIPNRQPAGTYVQGRTISNYMANQQQKNHQLSSDISGEVSHIVADLMQNQSHSFSNLPTSSFPLGQHKPSSNSMNIHSLNLSAQQLQHRKRESLRFSTTSLVDRSWLGKQDRDGILVYCNELSRQVESKNTELMKSLKECSSYKALVEQKIQECARDGGNELSCIVEQLQKERSDLKTELVEVSGNEEFLKAELERADMQMQQQDKLLGEYESLVNEKQKEIQEARAKSELAEEKASRLKADLVNMQDIYDTKEKLQVQLENRIRVLELENAQFIQKVSQMQQDSILDAQSIEQERNSIIIQSNAFQQNAGIIASIFQTTAQFIQEFRKFAVDEQRNEDESTAVAVPSVRKLLTEFDFTMLDDNTAALQFLNDWICALYEQVEHQTNLVGQLTGEVQIQSEKVRDIEKDLKDSVEIAQILKEKEMKVVKELQSVRLSNEEEKKAVLENAIAERSLLDDQQESRVNLQIITEKLILASQEVESLKEEMQMSDQLKIAKEHQERLLRTEMTELEFDLERERNTKLVFQNALFKICHIVPEVELEQLVGELISNSEQLMQSQEELEKQQMVVEEFSHKSSQVGAAIASVPMQGQQLQEQQSQQQSGIEENSVNSRVIISKAKLHQHHISNLNAIVAKTNKLRQRENAILASIDEISLQMKNKAQKISQLEREFCKMRSQLNYEQKRNEAMVLDRQRLIIDAQSKGYFIPNSENIRSQGDDTAFGNGDSIGQQQVFSNKENQSGQLEDENDNNYYSQQSLLGEKQRISIVEQQRAMLMRSPVNQSKDRLISSLLNSNSVLRSNLSSLKPSGSLASVVASRDQYNSQYSSPKQQRVSTLAGTQDAFDRNQYLTMKLEDKLNQSRKNLFVYQQQQQQLNHSQLPFNQ